uniref:G-protein coupled receptors family 1 profile domain-containing protein n=1 Tax=Astatotilapia calliptera TaxID=8154 RepID=A0A3P8N8Y9_ASTCA
MWRVVIWINTCFFLPVTILFFCCVCCAGRRYQVPVIYYTNLIISLLIHHSMIFFWEEIMHYNNIARFIYYSAVTASLYFRLLIALERYCFIACPLLDCLRQTEGSVLVCVLVWVLCIVSVALAVFSYEFVRLRIYAALPAPLFIFCLAGTLKALPAATSVPTEEKRRTVGTLVLLLLNYFLINLPAVIMLTLNSYRHPYAPIINFIIVILFLFSSLLDLILFAFMCKGPIDRLLARLCCCSMESNNTGDVTDVSTDRSDHVVRDEGNEETGSHDREDEEELESVK